MQKPKEIFPALTGIRFAAASMVFLFHYADLIFPPAVDPSGYFFLLQCNVGVSVFFVLSGFLISHRYFDSVTNWTAFGGYLLKRVVRIFPLYWAVLFVHFSYHFIRNSQPFDIVTFLLNATLLHGYSAKYFFSGLVQSWSLTVEETFYLYAPFCFFLIRNRHFFLRQIPLLIGAGFLLVALASFYQTAFFGNWVYLFVGTFFGRCFEFFVGIFLALRLKNHCSARQGFVYTLAGGLLVILLLVVMGAYAEHYGPKSTHESIPGVLVFNFFVPLAIGLLYYGLLTERTTLNKWLSSRFSNLLGSSSYAFYLLHVGVPAQVIYYHVSTNPLLLFLILQAVSIAAYKLFEKPVYFFILRRFAPFRK